MASVDDYHITIEGVLDIHECRSTFLDFLKTIHDEDSLMFFDAVEKYQLLRRESNRYVAAKAIVEKYIEEAALSQINLSNAAKMSILKKMEKCSATYCPNDLFSTAQTIIIGQLREDAFPHFLKSSTFKHFLTQKGSNAQQFLELIGQKKSEMSEEDYTGSSRRPSFKRENIEREWKVEELLQCCNNPEVFAKPSFNDLDFEVLRALIECTEMWTFTRKNDQQTNYISNYTFAHNKRDIKMFKEVIVLPYSSEEVLWALTDSNYIQLNEPNMTMKHISYLSISAEESYSVSINHVKLNSSSSFVSGRELLLATSVKKDLSGNYVLLKRSCKFDNVVMNSTVAEYFGGIYIETISDKLCKMTSIGRLDMHGKMSVSAMNHFTRMRRFKTCTCLMTSLLDRRNKGLKKPESSFRVLDTLASGNSGLELEELVLYL